MLKLHTLINARGYGELPRLIMEYSGIKYEYVQVPMERSERKIDYPFEGETPAIEVDGNVINEINSISSFVAKIGGLYPQDPIQALQADNILFRVIALYKEFQTSFGQELMKQFDLNNLEYKIPTTDPMYEEYFNETLPNFLKALENNMSKYFVGTEISIADISFFWFIDAVATAAPDVMEKLKAYEKLFNLFESIQSDSKLQQYLKFRSNAMIF